MMKLPILPCAEKLELVLSTAPKNWLSDWFIDYIPRYITMHTTAVASEQTIFLTRNKLSKITQDIISLPCKLAMLILYIAEIIRFSLRIPVVMAVLYICMIKNHYVSPLQFILLLFKR